MSVDKLNNNGLEIHPRKSSRNPAVHLTDTDFADDIALISGSLFNAQNLLSSLESAAKCAGLHFNESKTVKFFVDLVLIGRSAQTVARRSLINL